MANGHNPSNVWVTGWRVYEGKALKISMTLNLVDFGETPQDAIANVHAFIAHEVASGLLPNEPGLEAGERTETIKYVVRGKKRSGEAVVLHLYFDKHSFLKLYIDNDEQRQEFNEVAALDFNSLPVWLGGNAPERGADIETDKYIIPVCEPFQVVWKANPDYNPDETDANKKKPARLFVRYAPKTHSTVPPTNAAPPNSENVQNNLKPPSNGDKPATPKSDVKRDWTLIYSITKNLEHFNGQTKHVKNAIDKLISEGELDPLADDMVWIKTVINHYATGEEVEELIAKLS